MWSQSVVMSLFKCSHTSTAACWWVWTVIHKHLEWSQCCTKIECKDCDYNIHNFASWDFLSFSCSFCNLCQNQCRMRVTMKWKGNMLWEVLSFLYTAFPRTPKPLSFLCIFPTLKQNDSHTSSTFPQSATLFIFQGSKADLLAGSLFPPYTVVRDFLSLISPAYPKDHLLPLC